MFSQRAEFCISGWECGAETRRFGPLCGRWSTTRWHPAAAAHSPPDIPTGHSGAKLRIGPPRPPPRSRRGRRVRATRFGSRSEAESRNHRSWPEPPDRCPSPAAWNSGLCDDGQPAGAGSRKPQKSRTRTRPSAPTRPANAGLERTADRHEPEARNRSQQRRTSGQRQYAHRDGPTREACEPQPEGPERTASGGWRS